MLQIQRGNQTRLHAHAYTARNFRRVENSILLDFSSGAAARRSLDRYNFHVDCITPGWYFEGGKYYQAGWDEPRVSSDFGATGIIVEEATSNLCKYSSENNAVWVAAANTTKTAGTAQLFDGKTGINVAGTAVGARLYHETDTATDNRETAYIIFENSVADPTTHVDLQLYLVVGDVALTRARLNLSTGAVTIVGGSCTGYARRINSKGPHGNPVWMLILTTADPCDSFDTRRVDVFPCPVSGTGTIHLYHTQIEDSMYAHTPLVTGVSTYSKSTEFINTSTFNPQLPTDGYTVRTRACRALINETVGAVFAHYANFGADFFLQGFDSSVPSKGIVGTSVSSNIVTCIATSGVDTSSPVYMSGSFGDSFCAVASGSGSGNDDVTQTGLPDLGVSAFSLGSGAGVVYYFNGKILSVEIISAVYSAQELESISL